MDETGVETVAGQSDDELFALVQLIEIAHSRNLDSSNQRQGEPLKIAGTVY